MKLSRFGRLGVALILSIASLLTISLPATVGATPNNCTWTGATNNNFNNSGNWSNCGGVVPQSGDNLVFDTASLTGNVTLTDDMSGLSVGSITLQGSNSGFYSLVISGTNSLTINGNVSDNETDSGTTLQFKNDLVLAGPSTFNSGNGVIDVEGSISGTGNLTTATAAGGLFGIYLNGSNSFTGGVTATSGQLEIGSASGFGNSSNQVSINDGAQVSIGGCSDSGFTVPNDITLTGASAFPGGAYPVSKLSAGGVCRGGGASADENYGQPATSSQEYTLSGTVTLGSDTVFGTYAKLVTITGPLTGNYKFTLPNNWGGSLDINSSNNTSGMPNGSYTPDPITASLTDSQPTHTVYIGNNAIVTIDGVRGDTTVASGGVLKGNGQVGNLSMLQGGTAAPGHSPGCITVSGNLNEGGTYQAEIGGTTACSQYDQLIVTGNVVLNDGGSPAVQGVLQVSVVNGFKPQVGQKFEIINNKGSNPVTDTFSGLAEGATVNVGGNVFKISYKGGDGNDVVLTVITAATPDTGFGLTSFNSALPMLGALTVAGGFYLISRNIKHPASKRR